MILHMKLHYCVNLYQLALVKFHWKMTLFFSQNLKNFINNPMSSSAKLNYKNFSLGILTTLDYVYYNKKHWCNLYIALLVTRIYILSQKNICTQKKSSHNHEIRHECSLAWRMLMIKILTPRPEKVKLFKHKSDAQLEGFKSMNAHTIGVSKWI